MSAHTPVKIKTGSRVEVTYGTVEDYFVATGILWGKTRETITVGDRTIPRDIVLRIRRVRGVTA